MAILVIGGTGFIGARLTERLVSKGEEVICFDLYPNYDKVSHLQEKIKIIVGNVSYIEDIIEAIRKFRIEKIINLAYMLGGESEAELHRALRINVLGMNNVFEAARLMSIKRVVFASSIVIYGPQFLFGERVVTEEDFCQPTLVYGAHKLWNEFMAKKYMEHHGMSITGLRIAVVSGPGRKTGLTAWASTYVDFPVIGKPVEIPFRSNQKTLITYVDDAVEFFVRLCFKEDLKYPVYNSCAYSVTIGELARIVRKYLPNADIQFNDEAQDPPWVWNWSSERLEKEFQFKLLPVEEMVKKHINEVRRNSKLSDI